MRVLTNGHNKLANILIDFKDFIVQGVSKRTPHFGLVNVSWEFFYLIKFQGKKYMFQKKYAQPGRFAYNYFPQL